MLVSHISNLPLAERYTGTATACEELTRQLREQPPGDRRITLAMLPHRAQRHSHLVVRLPEPEKRLAHRSCRRTTRVNMPHCSQGCTKQACAHAARLQQVVSHRACGVSGSSTCLLHALGHQPGSRWHCPLAASLHATMLCLVCELE